MCVGERFEVTAETAMEQVSVLFRRSDSGIICLAPRCKPACFGESPATQSLYHADKHIMTMHKDQPAGTVHGTDRIFRRGRVQRLADRHLE